jgi:hypothetical protein
MLKINLPTLYLACSKETTTKEMVKVKSKMTAMLPPPLLLLPLFHSYLLAQDGDTQSMNFLNSHNNIETLSLDLHNNTDNGLLHWCQISEEVIEVEEAVD